MKYLYGNGSLSSLDQNYLEFLRLSIDFSVDVLQAETRISKLLAAIDDARALADVERVQVDALSKKVLTLLDDALADDSKVLTVSLRDSMKAACATEAKRATYAIESNLQNFIDQSNADMKADRAANLKRLEKVLQHCDLPGSVKRFAIILNAQGAYTGTLTSLAQTLLRTEMALSIPSGNVFNDPIRLDTLMPELQIDLPDTGGWLKRGNKIAPQRLSKEYVTEVSQSDEGVRVILRNAPKEGQPGFNVLFGQNAIQVSRVSKHQEESEPYTVSGADADKLRQLFLTLYKAADEISWNRTSLLSASIENEPLETYPEPDQIVLWLLEQIAPVVINISKNTLSPRELVLKRVLGDDKREEVFVSKTELYQKLSSLTDAHKAYFAPLALDRENQKLDGLPEPVKSKIIVPENAENAKTVFVMDALNTSMYEPLHSAAEKAEDGDSASDKAAEAEGDTAEQEKVENTEIELTVPIQKDSTTDRAGYTEEISLLVESEKSLALELPDEQTSELDLDSLDEDESMMLNTKSSNSPAPQKSVAPPPPASRGSIPPMRSSSLPPARPSGTPSAAPPPPPSKAGRVSLPPSNLGGTAKFGETGRSSSPLISDKTKQNRK